MLDAVTIPLHAGPDHLALELLGGLVGGLLTALILFFAVKRLASGSEDRAPSRSDFQ